MLNHIKKLKITFHNDAEIEKGKDPNKAYENKEVVVSMDANTIVYPRAVVVESLNTLLTNCTVSRSWRADDSAVRTEICWV